MIVKGSPVVADVYMENLKDMALISALCLPMIYKRYVNYIFTILPKDNTYIILKSSILLIIILNPI